MNSIPSSQNRTPLLLTVSIAMLSCGLLSLFLGKELCWDLANYHFYNPYAYLYHRSKFDFWPSSFIHQYINPTIDLLSYFLITHFRPAVAEFLLGAIHGIAAWLLFLIARLLATEYVSIAFALTLVGILGPTIFPGMGSFQNDNLICIFVLGFVFVFVKILISQSLISKVKLQTQIAMAGFILGFGVGLKLTAMVYAVGAVASIAFVPLSMKQRLEWLSCLSIGLCIGFMLPAAHWMWRMWQAHHNPFFPFFNHLFHSSEFAPINWRDTRFLPQGIWQTLFFPFYFSFDGRTADAPFRDFRFLMVYILFILVAIKKISHKKQINHQEIKSIARGWLFSFFIISYVTWQYYFSIARYAAPLELLAPVIIYLLVKNLLKPGLARISCLTVLFCLLIITVTPIPAVRAPWYHTSFFNVQLPPLVQQTSQAVVLMPYTAYVMDSNPRPQTYLIPYFPSRWRFIGVPFWHETVMNAEQTLIQIRQHLSNSNLPIYLLTAKNNMPTLYRFARQLGLNSKGACEQIFSDRQKISHQKVLLCPVG